MSEAGTTRSSLQLPSASISIAITTPSVGALTVVSTGPVVLTRNPRFGKVHTKTQKSDLGTGAHHLSIAEMPDAEGVVSVFTDG